MTNPLHSSNRTSRLSSRLDGPFTVGSSNQNPVNGFVLYT
jgi:hypothetical protein